MIYPDIRPDWGYSLEPQYKTDKLGPNDGDFTQRRRRRRTPLNVAQFGYSARLPYEKKVELQDFFNAQYGSWQSFTFYDFVNTPIAEYQIGTGDDIQTDWLVDNFRDIVNPIVKINGSITNDFVIENRTGSDGQDVLRFPIPPATGLPISLSGDGHLRVPNCIFKDDALPAALEKWRRYGIKSITILQVSS